MPRFVIPYEFYFTNFVSQDLNHDQILAFIIILYICHVLWPVWSTLLLWFPVSQIVIFIQFNSEHGTSPQIYKGRRQFSSPTTSQDHLCIAAILFHCLLLSLASSSKWRVLLRTDIYQTCMNPAHIFPIPYRKNGKYPWRSNIPMVQLMEACQYDLYGELEFQCME